MTTQADACTPSAVIDRISLVLDAFDGPGRLSLASCFDLSGVCFQGIARTGRVLSCLPARCAVPCPGLSWVAAGGYPGSSRLLSRF